MILAPWMSSAPTRPGRLRSSTIKLAAHVDQAGEDSEEVLRLASLNSAFQSGIKSPLDDAILSHRQIDAGAWRKLDEIPFDFERRRVSVLLGDGTTRLLVLKGAPEEILARSVAYLGPDGGEPALDAASREKLLEHFERWGEEGYRVLGVASRAVQGDTITKSDEDKLTFAGFALFVDPPKRDAADAVRALSQAGVEVKILSGDNERITRHICTEIGIPIHGVLTGEEVARLSEEALAGEGRVGQSVLPRHAAAEAAHLARPEARRPRRWLSSATASTTLRRCMGRMSASQWTMPPTWPRRPPISCCSSAISACCMTA